MTTYPLVGFYVTSEDLGPFVRLFGSVEVVIENNTITVVIKYEGQAGGLLITNIQGYHMTSKINTLPVLRTDPDGNAYALPNTVRTAVINNNSYFSYILTTYAQITYRLTPFSPSADAYPSTSITGEFNLNICPTEGFVFVDTSTGPSKVVFLPDPTSNGNKMIFIKDKSWNAGTNNIKVIAPVDITIDSAKAFNIADNGGCLILVSDGANYYVANYCKPATQFSYGVEYTTSTVTAQINKFNITGTDLNNNKGVQLPDPSSGAICMICLGNMGNYSTDAVLYLKAITGSVIDNNTAEPYPHIRSTPSQGNPVATFISDGTTWYTAGVYNGSDIVISAQANVGGVTEFSSNKFMKVDSNIPVYNLTYIQLAPFQGFNIMKNIQSTSSSLATHSYRQVGNALIKVRNRITNTNNSISCGSSNACLWVYTETVSGLTYYWPMITYVPQ